MTSNRKISALALAVASAASASLVLAQDGAISSATDGQLMEEVLVKGIRGSLANALDQKRNADSLVEVIIAEDIGKLPDKPAEVLENVTVSKSLNCGRWNRVQIRGTNANRVLFNGVATVSFGRRRHY